MSGQQIGTAVGFVAGFFLPGGPQVWAAVGGAIGGWISPTQVNGPQIGDGAPQSSAEGEPIAWIIATAGWVKPNIVDKSPRRSVKKTDDGKGSGVETNTFEAHQDFVMMICESSETRNSVMTGVLICRVDGKIVYDMRAASNFGAENAKFLQNHTFYNGAETQLPDPTCEAFPNNGVGNTPAYRGVFTMVARDINLTPYGDRIPAYEFVMVGAGSSDTIVTEYYAPPSYGRFADTHYPLVDPESSYSFVGARSIVNGGSRIEFEANTIAEIITHFNDLGYNGTPSNLSEYQGYSATDLRFSTDFTIDSAEAQPTVVDGVAVILVYSEEVAQSWYNANAGSGCVLLPYVSPGQPEWYGFDDGRLGRIQARPVDPNYVNYNNCTGYPSEPDGFPYLQGIAPLYILVKSKKVPADAIAGDPCLLGVPVLLPDTPGFVIDCAGVVSPEVTYTEVSGFFDALQAEDTSVVGGDQSVYDNYTVGPILESSDPAGTEAFWTAAYDAAVLEGTVPAGLVYGVDYPQSINDVYLATTSSTEITSNSVPLAEAITRICERGGITAADIDVTELDQMLMGYPILQSYNAADCLRPLMTGFTCYGSEYDAQLHFHKHGEDVEIVIDEDDFIQGSETDKSVREQQIEYPRLLSVTAIDPTQDYASRPQYERRTTPDVRAIGQQQIQVPIVMMPDTQRQLAAIGMKVAWARANGSREFSVPYAEFDVYLSLVAGKPLGLSSQRRIVEEMGMEDGELRIKALYDRQSAYVSDVTATPAPPPTPPPSNLSGVTLFAAMNLPVLRDQDDKVGLYFGVAGLLAGWSGCLLQWSVDDGATWQTAIASMTESSVLGYLDAPLPLAPASGDDVTNTLSVSVHGGDLNSITYLQYLNEGNPFAILHVDGTAEIGQFLDADEITADEYDLTTLARGRLGTAPAAHAQGARFVGLSSVYFLEVPIGYIGRTLLFRPVTFGTAPESNAIYTLIFSQAVSQTELAPEFLQATRNGSDDFTVTVVPRHRLGTDAMPVASSNFTGFAWEFDVGGIVVTASSVDATYTLTAAQQTTFWGGPQSAIDVSVSQTNRITGSGPAQEATL